MSDFINYIHDRPGFKIGKHNGLFRGIREEKSGIDVHFFDEGKLLDLETDNVVKEENAEDMELKRIDVAISEKKNRL